MAGGVDQVQHIGFAVLGGIIDPNGLRLDGDAALALDVHAVQHLRLHVAQGDGVRLLDQAVGERGFPVVDMRDDGEITDVCKVCHAPDMQGFAQAGKSGVEPICGTRFVP